MIIARTRTPRYSADPNGPQERFAVNRKKYMSSFIKIIPGTWYHVRTSTTYRVRVRACCFLKCFGDF